MIVSHKHKFIFIHIPKTGGTSICNALEYHIGPKEGKILSPFYGMFIGPEIGDLTQHMGVGDICNLYKDDFIDNIINEYFVFAFVRNPWDRLVSFYHFYRQNQNMRKMQPDVADRVDHLPFEQWVREISVGDSESFTQVSYIWHNGIRKVDFVGRFENLTDDFNVVSRKFGFDTKLEKLNSTDHLEYRCYYTADLAGFVADKFSDDIERFGYTF